jgi:hypothetical protein
VPIRAPLPRVLTWALLLLCGLVAVAGGLALRGPEIVAVGVAGVLAGCMAAGITREMPVSSRRRSPFEAATSVGATTVGVLLVIAGIATLAGGAVAFLTVGAGLVTALIVRMAHGRRAAARPTPDRTADPLHPSAMSPVRPQPAGELASLLPPVAALPTSQLGQEWLRTSAVLAGRLDAAARQSLVARREEALDELERRDPAGFSRWLAAGPTLSSDPAGYVHGGPLRGDPAADTDAA